MRTHLFISFYFTNGAPQTPCFGSCVFVDLPAPRAPEDVLRLRDRVATWLDGQSPNNLFSAPVILA